ncbi:murein hydrolase activator EnvC family protein [Clostridium perfringens]|uniref:Cell wall-binding protein n=2 Tax=Clostridium perfringens TaxID=1502 RepID=A0A2X2X2W3_CLOPF|nr:M23 family metallopeptidase [Clostridium perfringens]ABG87711.1 peptidase, M23/M37 family protein [Clostridium perfringens SM101]EJT5916070.1 peptidoglycan DD-metalloendopeptidase family protein [Clostridium perfringens]EJT5939940.1 peptidoglycan DD-metalloendopeptidase family protein [Clostridium perfringens]EJT6134896.1 peptidoglycan DD-metalloendopeptidase family protein [Clostridium perfringens]EJT6149996.1 peptidoglycan DD-metalloendopeptidase family protein [Clostridium perfringens]
MNKRKLTAIILSISMIFAVSINSNKIVQAKTTEEAQQEINSNKSKIDDLKDKQNDINSEKSKSQSKLDEIQKQIADKNQKLLTSQKKVDEYKANIDSLKDSIDKLQGQINDIQINMDKKKKEEKEKEIILSGRIRSAYKSNLSNQFLYIMLESKNVGDFISNVSSIKYVVDRDNKLIDDIKKVQDELKSEESQLKSQEEELSSKKTKLENEKKEYDNLVSQYQSQLNELNSLEEQKQAEINSLSEKERAVLDEINSYEEDNANLKDYINNLINEKKSVKLNSDNNSTTSTSNNEVSSEQKSNSSSGFMRPAPGGVTDPFGPRVHPVTGKRSVHTGADLGAAYGTPILASKSGTVVEAGWNTAYGNMVIIDHGDGTSTLYGHSSRLAVQAGQHVSQGQVIAYVGSTGYSTGPHLHFGIMINGQWVNPMNYIN